MWIYEFVKKLYGFRGIYRKFSSQNSHWIVKNHCNLIPIVGYDFGSNLTIKSSHICWKLI